LTSDIAWFAGGASTDGKHLCRQPGFSPDFNALWQTLPTGHPGNEACKALSDKMRHVVFDMVRNNYFFTCSTLSDFCLKATLWDRTFSGTTVVLHVKGTTIPNMPAQPQFLCASTYLPPAFVAANPGSHRPIAQIAQMFIKAVGVLIVQQWRVNTL
jgi:hypothetical protein